MYVSIMTLKFPGVESCIYSCENVLARALTNVLPFYFQTSTSHFKPLKCLIV